MKEATDFWPRLILDEKDIPESFRDFFAKIYTTQTPFPYTVFILPERYYHRKANPKLICLFNDRICIAEKVNKQINSVCFNIYQISYLELGVLLLYSWLKIHGVVDGHLISVTVEFNTVVQDLFKPIIEKTRLLIHHIELSIDYGIQLQTELQKFDFLNRQDYKYMNYGKDSLMPGCKVNQILFQPDIQVKYMKYFTRSLSLVHQTILTDKELIIIKDDSSDMKMDKKKRYGGISRYIPLQKIKKTELISDPKEGTHSLRIYFSENEMIESLFSAPMKPELECLQKGLRQIESYLAKVIV